MSISATPSATARRFAAPGSNRLLELLPDADRQQLLARAERRTFVHRDVLVPAGRPIERVYFLTSAIGSALTIMADGSAIETGTVGNEGCIGLQVLFGVERVPGETICQVPGDGFVLRASVFRDLLGASPALVQLLLRYAQLFLIQSSQSTACNRLHTVEQRYARWVLMTHDRRGSDAFALTQEFLAMMLGVRRASVSVAASALRQAGLLDYHRGGVRIIDRAGLEAAACECYRVTRDEYERALGTSSDHGRAFVAR
jgi:CRP-like cAMP-binding protein